MTGTSDNNPIKFAGSTGHASSPPGEPSNTQPTKPLGATVDHDKYFNGSISARGTMTGTSDSMPRSAQQWHSWVPPNNSQYTSGGSIPTQEPPLNQTPGPSSRPEFNQGQSGAKVYSDSGPRQIISGCFRPMVNNDSSFNNSNYDCQVNNDNRKRGNKGRRSKKSQKDESSESESESESSDSD